MLALMCAANLLAIFDSEIVGVALPSVQRDFGLTATETQWIVSSTMITWGGLLLLGGRAGDYFGRRRVFLAGLALFLITSQLSGLAWSGGVMVAMRALHGVSTALMYPTALSILADTFAEGRQRNRALAVWAGMGGTGSTLGLLSGGAIIDRFGWHWGFYLQVPITAAMIVLSFFVLKPDRDADRRRGLNLLSGLTITAGLGLIVYGVSQVPVAGWVSPRTLGVGMAAVAALALFAVVEARSAEPLMPLQVLRSRLRLGGNIVIFVVTAIVFSMSYLYSLYSQQVLGYSPLEYAVTGAVLPLTVIVTAYAGQLVLHRVGFRAVAVTGTLLFGAGALLFTQVSGRESYFELSFFALALIGAGLGTSTLAASAAALTGVKESEVGLASGVNTATVMVGGGLGVALVATVAAARTGASTSPEALTAGFQAGYGVGVVLSIIGLVLALALLGRGRRRAGDAGVALPLKPVSLPGPRSGDHDRSLETTKG
ncbi:MFS transporter [Actinomycetes bacterium KLBMP 9797]